MTITAKPILMNAEMVRATLREIKAPGTGKTQTRRVIKYPYQDFDDDGWPLFEDDDGLWRRVECPYGTPGDLLYVRESWQAHDWAADCVTIRYRAEEKTKGFTDQIEQIPYPQGEKTAFKFVKPEGPHKWKPSIHMPRWASRITLEVTDVRVQRLKDISILDAISEGVTRDDSASCYAKIMGLDWRLGNGRTGCPRKAFHCLWTSINGPESWEADPWVWAVSFKPHLINVDQFIKERAAA